MFFLNIHVLSCRNEHSQSLAYRNTLLPRFSPRVQTLREHWLMPPAVCLALNKTQLELMMQTLVNDPQMETWQTIVYKMLLFVNDTIYLNSCAYTIFQAHQDISEDFSYFLKHFKSFIGMYVYSSGFMSTYFKYSFWGSAQFRRIMLSSNYSKNRSTLRSSVKKSLETGWSLEEHDGARQRNPDRN